MKDERKKWIDEALKSDLLIEDVANEINHYTAEDREKHPELFERSRDNPYPAYIGSSYWTERRYWYVRLASYGDYDNSCQVERANFKVLDERFDWVSDVGRGGYGHCAIGFYEDEIDDVSNEDWQEFTEMVDSLSDYPALDDEAVSECECEAENEAWESWLESDIRSELTKQLEAQDYQDVVERLDKLDGNSLWEFVLEAMNTTNTYFEHESGGNVYLSIERIMPELIKLVYLWLMKQDLIGEVSDNG